MNKNILTSIWKIRIIPTIQKYANPLRREEKIGTQNNNMLYYDQW